MIGLLLMTWWRADNLSPALERESSVEPMTFEEWVLSRQRGLLRTAWLLTGDAAAAEDLVQTVLLRCWPRWRRIADGGQADAYVRRALTRTYISGRRRRWRDEVPTAAPPDLTSADRTGERDDRATLTAALGRLPRGQRAVLVLRFADDLSEAQTAAALGCSTGTVKSQSARALKALRADATLCREIQTHD